MDFWWLLVFFIPAYTLTLDEPVGPPQQPCGPGGEEYLHDSVRITDRAAIADGYFVYEPAAPRPDSAPVIMLLHGYASFNPISYGGWIEHLVRKGNIVIFPRYQAQAFELMPRVFIPNVRCGFSDAVALLQTEPGRVQPKLDQFNMIGHSYGGALTAYFGVHHETYDLPEPQAMLICAPGTGPFYSADLASYQQLPEELKLLIIINDEDGVVQEDMAYRIFRTATHTPNRNLIRQYPDPYGLPPITAFHNECYSVDSKYDSGMRNPTVGRAFRLGYTNATDYYGYWKLFDALLACARRGDHCSVALGDTPEQRFMGYWEDGRPIRELDVLTPDDLANTLSQKPAQ